MTWGKKAVRAVPDRRKTLEDRRQSEIPVKIERRKTKGDRRIGQAAYELAFTCPVNIQYALQEYIDDYGATPPIIFKSDGKKLTVGNWSVLERLTGHDFREVENTENLYSSPDEKAGLFGDVDRLCNQEYNSPPKTGFKIPPKSGIFLHHSI